MSNCLILNHSRKFKSPFLLVFFSALLLLPRISSASSQLPLILHVDASHVDQGIMHGDLIIPVRSGPLTLDYPKWIPGEHGPTGTTINLAGLSFTANGSPLPWRRDLIEPFQFHMVVPRGAKYVEAQFDYIDPIGAPQRWESDEETTAAIAMISWYHFIFYPHGELSQDIPVTADIALPPGWQFATALEAASTVDGTVRFKTASLYTLADSPLMTGLNFQKIPLTSPGVVPPVELDIAADNPDNEDIGEDKLNAFKSLVQQEEALFGSEHYRHYNFLVFLSSHISEYGLEHSESSECGFSEDAFNNEMSFKIAVDTPAHEMFHSWNGKFRRPADLATPEFIKPQQTDLLWVYEGLTQYYGFVLSARCGLLTPDQVRDHWAAELDDFDHEAGRQWRPLQDTADDAQEVYVAPNVWGRYRRGPDFSRESSIDWLDADAIIRRLTDDTKSLDDFCRLFYSQPTLQITSPVLSPYSEADVISALNKIAPYDWKEFWNIRLNTIEGTFLDQSYADTGWQLVYNDVLNDEHGRSGTEDAGFWCGVNGIVSDIDPDSVAFKAGLAPGQQIIAVNGYPFSRDAVVKQFNAAKNQTAPIELIVEIDNMYRVLQLDYHGGYSYPHFQRINSAPDYLSQILSPLAVTASMTASK
jgi:predicted metalloprotease with PDZ domain